MRPKGILILALTLATALMLVAPMANAQDASAPTYYLKTTIPIPAWANVTPNIDISWVSSDGKLFIIGDRSTSGVDVFDAVNYSFIRVAGAGRFVGVGPTGTGGPNGVVTVSPVEAAAGDGDSTLKVVNLFSDATQSVATGGVHRVDEMAYDPATDILIAANDREDTPFLTLFKVHPLSITAKIPMPQATDGIEQPVIYNGRFYVAIPATTANPNGEIDVINPTTAAIERVISTDGCKGPSGLAPGILGRWITGGGGCMVDPGAGTTIAIPDAGGDEVASVPALGVYAYMIAATRTLNLASGYTNQVYQKLDANGGHNLAANQTNGEIFVPDYDGKVVEVFAPTVPFGGGKGK